ncbi:MAG TPA: fasciclin domain-containing protein [Prolixibacteraceae bacterium]|nr:fasciclin domain-containing protein [Prolixibacteraceae bacterium]HQE52555.1 fasciclin domain-containing protein [Prolixibacteraceae bacterium]HQH76652.1 fasciclin domain-containing protein [Prolixibacteraceae bacterium]HQJ85750.1 fasciclin domain-containing protein [Prolixibacteraceae bacterium]
MKIYKMNLSDLCNRFITVRLQGKGLTWSAVVLAVLFLLPACNSDDVGDNFYTFTGETVGQYIKNRPETYSEFAHILDTTGVMGLMNAYGDYTCFLPDNEAVIRFYKSKGKTSIKDFSLDVLKKIAYDHIIKDFTIATEDFIEGFLTKQTMSGRYVDIGISSDETGLVYTVNTTSKITEKDIEAHNGIIHVISEVLSPTENTLVEVISADQDFSLFFEALQATGLDKNISLIKDEDYVPDPDYVTRENTGVVYNYARVRVPRERKYGFTALMESNETFKKNGINNLDDLKAYAKQAYDKLYPQDASISDITNRNNSLNRFVAYHLINKKLPMRLFIEKYDNTGMNYESTGETHSVKVVDMFEYLETLCPNTLIEVRTLRTTNEYNIFNMIPESGKAIRLTANFDNDALNGVYHEIDNILVYTAEVERMLSTKRLRMDVASFFPEFVNNNIRIGNSRVGGGLYSERYYLPNGFVDRIKASASTEVHYFNADDRFMDYQGDELFLSGLYDFDITTIPIPPGTYEVRFGYQPTGLRGVAQLYWDGIPTGIPLDLRTLANDPDIGYQYPGTDTRDPEGFENDKAMRNRGYMKGPASYTVIAEWWYTGASARMSEDVLRRILGIYTFNEWSTHTFSVKAVKSGEFMFDYLEFVPLEVLEYEDIY